MRTILGVSLAALIGLLLTSCDRDSVAGNVDSNNIGQFKGYIGSMGRMYTYEHRGITCFYVESGGARPALSCVKEI